MKCPKCEYLGFETGDRCKNCGYDFSLATAAVTRDADLPLNVPDTQDDDAANRWLGQTRLETARSAPTPAISIVDTRDAGPLTPGVPAAARPVVPAAGASAPIEPAPSVAAHIRLQKASLHRASSLPLFTASPTDWDEPLITVPPAPRPLAVRRTPERPRLRSVSKTPRKFEADHVSDPVLAFAEEPAASHAAVMAPADRRARTPAVETSGAARRLAAVFVDHAILLSVDAAVVYFTFQIAGVPFESWRDVPLLPLALFLMLVKLAYFSVFTTLGGQTVGKMATGIRVVADNNGDVDPAQAVRRTLAALASFATAGIGFAPALVGGDRRALHDHVARTRVVRPLHE